MDPHLLLDPMTSGLTVLPMLLLLPPPLHTTTRRRSRGNSRKGRAPVAQLLNLGVWMILSFSGRRGLLPIKLTLLKAKSKALSGGVLGG